ncbi:MAG: low molecular weight phosphotyrosine protein phosphatase [Bacteroidetes bacterium]|nr:low molecular weight phosphotyrosine protein phosphatase [Bacteroidota bacterium]
MATKGTPEERVKVLFVCLGNICRSPLAEGIFRARVEAAGLPWLEIDSAGTGAWHVGEKPDSRMRETARSHGISLESIRARKLSEEDLWTYDHIYAMDRSNLEDIRFLDASETFHDRVELFRKYDPNPDSLDVPDPYYGGRDGFETVFRIVDRTCASLLDSLQTRYGNELK